jgi:hypothetical protein
MESEAARLARTPFSLFFLVPIAREAGGFTYEAVFT